jgi:hypothetical protein
MHHAGAALFYPERKPSQNAVKTTACGKFTEFFYQKPAFDEFKLSK